MIALFIVGYAWLFRWLGASPVVGFALAAGLYFTGFVQFWWNVQGPLFALFPWVILPFSTRLSFIWKAALFYWVAVVWLLTNFYPPLQVSLAFVGLIILLACEPELFKPRSLAVLVLAAALAASTAALYLWDYLQATATTLYPGGRSLSGGTVPARFWLSWLWPAINFDRDYESTIGFNISEIGTVGLYYSLFVMCFLDFARWRYVWANAEQRRLIAILGVGLLMMLAWMALPLPSWIGAPLLWNHVQPPRMQYAGGLLFVCLLFVLSHHLGLRVSRAYCDLLCSNTTWLVGMEVRLRQKPLRRPWHATHCTDRFYLRTTSTRRSTRQPCHRLPAGGSTSVRPVQSPAIGLADFQSSSERDDQDV